MANVNLPGAFSKPDVVFLSGPSNKFQTRQLVIICNGVINRFDASLSCACRIEREVCELHLLHFQYKTLFYIKFFFITSNTLHTMEHRPTANLLTITDTFCPKKTLSRSSAETSMRQTEGLASVSFFRFVSPFYEVVK